MVAFEQVIEYLRETYPNPGELDVDRAMLTLYLIDWKAAIDLRRPVSNLEWRIERLPEPTPEQRDVVLSAIKHAPDCSWRGKHPESPDLTDEDKSIIRDIVSRVYPRTEPELLRLVYSTFPVLSQPRQRAPVNLVAMADKYKREYRDNIR